MEAIFFLILLLFFLFFANLFPLLTTSFKTQTYLPFLHSTLQQHTNMTVKAVCVFRANDKNVQGTIVFTQQDQSAPVHVKAEISGLTPGQHGFHIQ